MAASHSCTMLIEENCNITIFSYLEYCLGSRFEESAVACNREAVVDVPVGIDNEKYKVSESRKVSQPARLPGPNLRKKLKHFRIVEYLLDP